eukprot:jgi/Galph1/1008/GphlegSOOS_G5920.1
MIYIVFLFSILVTGTCASSLSRYSCCYCQNTIAAELQALQNFSILLELAKIADLTGVLENPCTTITLLLLLKKELLLLCKKMIFQSHRNSAFVKKILEYHIIDQPLLTWDSSAFTSLKTLEGSYTTIIKNYTGIFVNQAEMIQPNIIAGKSVI